MKTSRHYDNFEIPGGWLWFIHCPHCGVKMYVMFPRIRVIRCPECCEEFIEGGVS